MDVLYQLSYLGERVRSRLLMRIRATSIADSTSLTPNCCSQFGEVPSGFGLRCPRSWPKPRRYPDPASLRGSDQFLSNWYPPRGQRRILLALVLRARTAKETRQSPSNKRC